MYYTNEERRAIIFLKIDENLSLRKIGQRFHQMFPHRPTPSPKGILKMIRKHRMTSSIFNRPKPGRPRSATNEANEVLVLGNIYMKSQQSLREVAFGTGNSITSVWRILKRHKFHQYGVKLVQELKQEDYAKRLEFCEWMDYKIRDLEFLKNICFSDESTFHLTGYVNRHNCRYWSEAYWEMRSLKYDPLSSALHEFVFLTIQLLDARHVEHFRLFDYPIDFRWRQQIARRDSLHQ
ncbi:hypothetical protein HA402_011369 [Bradysia odoriphaga]|nr:hypothetical protein HA402_011369 [Bradysia odoriphaga]